MNIQALITVSCGSNRIMLPFVSTLGLQCMSATFCVLRMDNKFGIVRQWVWKLQNYLLKKYGAKGSSVIHPLTLHSACNIFFIILIPGLLWIAQHVNTVRLSELSMHGEFHRITSHATCMRERSVCSCSCPSDTDDITPRPIQNMNGWFIHLIWCVECGRVIILNFSRPLHIQPTESILSHIIHNITCMFYSVIIFSSVLRRSENYISDTINMVIKRSPRH